MGCKQNGDAVMNERKLRDDEVTAKFNTGAWRPEVRVLTVEDEFPRYRRDSSDDEPTQRIMLDTVRGRV